MSLRERLTPDDIVAGMSGAKEPKWTNPETVDADLVWTLAAKRQSWLRRFLTFVDPRKIFKL